MKAGIGYRVVSSFLIILIICSAITFAKKDGYSMDDILCTIDGIKHDAVFHGRDFTAELKLNEDEKNVPNLICAQYNSNGKLINAEIAKNNVLESKLTLSMPVDYETAYMKLFLLDDSLSPISGRARKLIESRYVYLNENFENAEVKRISITAKSGDTIAINDGYAKVSQSGTAESSSFMQYSFDKSTDTSSELVLEAEIKKDRNDADFLAEATMFMLRYKDADNNEKTKWLGYIKNGLFDDETTSLSKDTWTKYSMALDIKNHKYTTYINGIESEKGDLPQEMNRLNLWRISFNKKDKEGALEIRNIRAYKNDKPFEADINDFEEEKSIYTDNGALSVLKGKTALSPYSNKIYFNNKKQDTDTECIINGDETLVSIDTFKKLFNVNPVINGDIISVGDAIFTVGTYQMSCNGKKITIPVAPEIIDDQIMLPVDAYGKNVLGEKYYNDNAGMMLVSNTGINTSDTKITGNLREASRFMLFDRYSENELLEKLKAKNGDDLKAHPRLLATSNDFEKLKEEIASDKFKKKWYEILITKADELTKQNEIPVYDVSSGRLSNVSDALRENSIILGMAYQLTGDSRYADRLIDQVLAVCEFPDWYPDHYLGTSDIERSVAICFDWCYDVLTEEEKATIYSAAKEFGLLTANQIYCGSASFSNNFWGKTDTNWGGWVNSGVIELCLATAEMDPEYTTKVLERALRSMEYPISAIAPDGAWHEGVSYWAAFFNPTALGMASYESALGEPYKGVYQKGMEGMCNFKEYVTTPTGKTGSYNDGGSAYIEAFARLYIAKKNGWSNVMRAYTDEQEEFVGDKVGPYSAALSLLWYDTDVTAMNIENEYSLDGYFRETELVSMREAFNDKNAMWMMTDGGISNTSHSHLDTASFQFTLNGVNWARDLGSEQLYYSRTGTNYLKNAGLNNRLYYRRKAEGHNMVVINPTADKLELDENVKTIMHKPVSGAGSAYTYADLAEAYSENATSYTRGYMLSDNRRALTVRDEIELKKDNSDVYWYMHYVKGATVSSVTENGNTKIITLNSSDKKLRLVFYVEENGNPTQDYTIESIFAERMFDINGKDSSGNPISIKDNETSANINGEKLRLHINATGKINITVKMYMDDENISQINTSKISEWTVE